MSAYIYSAALYCPDCACSIKDRLKLEGKAPEDPADETSFDSDDYPKGPEPDGGGEADCPQHCDGCGVWLENPLTSHGVEYVLESIRESIEEAVEKGRRETWDRVMPMPGTGEESHTALHGLRHVEIVREWAEDVLNYNLEKDESALVGLFLELSKAP